MQRQKSHINLQFHEEHLVENEIRSDDRRVQPRLTKSYLALIRGVDAWGQLFEDNTNLVNLSSGGVYFHLWRLVKPDTRLFVVFRFSTTSRVPAACVALSGIVRRVEPQADFCYGIALAMQNHRFLWQEHWGQDLFSKTRFKEADNSRLKSPAVFSEIEKDPVVLPSPNASEPFQSYVSPPCPIAD